MKRRKWLMILYHNHLQKLNEPSFKKNMFEQSENTIIEDKDIIGYKILVYVGRLCNYLYL